ncbi:MAG: hypothetical protein WCA49_24285 [Candidatus Sulfotelmatobacter sp.]
MAHDSAAIAIVIALIGLAGTVGNAVVNLIIEMRREKHEQRLRGLEPNASSDVRRNPQDGHGKLRWWVNYAFFWFIISVVVMVIILTGLVLASRHFMLGLGGLITQIFAAPAAILSFISGVIQLGKEWKIMKPKTNIERVKLVIRKRSVMFLFAITLFLTVLAASIRTERASVAETGQPIGNVATFSVDDNYYPVGKMGDIGDMTISEQTGFVRYTYKTEGNGPHEWDWKYTDGQLSSHPAQFGGVMYLNPKNNWGTDPDGGYDLRSCHGAIKWEARSADGEVDVAFVIGGDKRNLTTKDQAKFPYPNTIDRSLGTRHLKAEWLPFDADLSKIPDDKFKRVVGGFGWLIKWESNGVKLNREQTGAEHPKTFTIEIRNIRYEK